jgi:cytoskeletal protein CcmA (bactofilin family)
METHMADDGRERPSGEPKTPFADWARSAVKSGPGKPPPSIIGEDLTITGNVISKGDIQVNGEIQGDVQSGSLLLGDKSKIIGSASAEDVLVRGHVVGSIRGLRVMLQAQSHLEGDIYHASLAIEQGAYFEGKSCRTDDPLAANAASPSTRRAEPGVKTGAEEDKGAQGRAGLGAKIGEPGATRPPEQPGQSTAGGAPKPKH